jgi:hypothetical protein
VVDSIDAGSEVEVGDYPNDPYEDCLVIKCSKHVVCVCVCLQCCSRAQQDDP